MRARLRINNYWETILQLAHGNTCMIETRKDRRLVTFSYPNHWKYILYPNCAAHLTPTSPMVFSPPLNIFHWGGKKYVARNNQSAVWKPYRLPQHHCDHQIQQPCQHPSPWTLSSLQSTVLKVLIDYLFLQTIKFSTKREISTVFYHPHSIFKR